MKDLIGVHRPLFNEHFGHRVTHVTVCASCKSSLHGQKKNKEIVNYMSFPNGIRVVLLVQRILKLHINSNFYGHQGFEVFASIFLHIYEILHETYTCTVYGPCNRPSLENLAIFRF